MTPPRRQLGFTITAAIVVANMIGTGVFTSTGFQANSLHDPVTILITWIVGGVLALCGAATYAELGSMWPKAGGEYVYLREAYHPGVGFMSGWVSLTAGFSAPIAASSLAFATYLAKLIPALASPAIWLNASLDLSGHHIFTIALGIKQAVAIGLIIAVTAMHSLDTKIGGWVQTGFTVAKVLLIVGFIIGGLTIGHGDWHNLAPQQGGLSNLPTPAFALALIYSSFAYSGWNAAAYVAGEVKDPARTLPRALLAGTGVVMVLYLLLNLVFLYAVPTSVLAGPSDSFAPVIEVGDVAARALFGDRAGDFVTSVIALALVSAVSAMVMAGPRVYAAMAEDHALPHQLARYNKRGVPTVAVITQGVLGILFVLVGDLGQLIRFVAFTLALFAALTVSSVFVMRHRRVPSPYRTFGYPVTPILFLLLSGCFAYVQLKENPKESLFVVAVLGLGGLLYAVFGRKPPATPSSTLPEARVIDSDQP
ncbi:MAG TPA: APC family permease [Kofleriaceae bacterium]|nr:APC family permease [Kofleriaceae bacterium]